MLGLKGKVLVAFNKALEVRWSGCDDNWNLDGWGTIVTPCWATAGADAQGLGRAVGLAPVDGDVDPGVGTVVATGVTA